MTEITQSQNGRGEDQLAALSRQIEQLQQALASRDLIGQAKGILMERYRLTADEAFERLRVVSQHSNCKLAAIAEHVAATGQWPLPGLASDPGQRRSPPSPRMSSA